MPSQLHFLNVKQGDCTWIKHADGKNTIIDVFNASSVDQISDDLSKGLETLFERKVFSAVKGNFNQKEYPVNPITYLQNFGVTYGAKNKKYI